MFKRILLIGLLSCLILPIGVLAWQETGVGTNLLAEVRPASPGPGESVTITLSGYGFDIDTSLISWYVNGILKSQATGKKTFTISLGLVGEQTKITVYVQARGGQKASKTFIFDPSEIDLFWETKTSQPAFYRGKALPSAGAKLKVVARPYLVNRAGQKVGTASLVYQWKKNDILLADRSGLGLDSITINTGLGDSQVKISVEAISVADNISATKNLVINLSRPEIIFYEKKPLTGINYGQVLPTEYSLFSDEVTVRAEPYFLPLNDNLIFKYLWTIDQSPAASRPNDPLAITVRRHQDASGSNRLSFSAQAKDSVVKNSLVVKYGNSLLKP